MFETDNNENSLKCKECGNYFSNNSNLNKHIKYQHGDERPHKCTVCNYAAVHLYTLERHMRWHLGENLNKCDAGGIKKFKVSSSKEYKCPLCKYECNKMNFFEKHMKIHSGEKHEDQKCYKCPDCFYSAKGKAILQAHLLIHTGEKPHKCEICDKSFRLKNKLVKHRVNVHKLELKHYTCPHCEKQFILERNMASHIKRYHGDDNNGAARIEDDDAAADDNDDVVTSPESEKLKSSDY